MLEKRRIPPKNTGLYRRIIVDSLLLLAAFLAPWYVVLALVLGTLLYFGWYELIAVAIVMDTLYGSTTVLGFRTYFPMATLAILAAFLVPQIRHYLRFGSR